MFTCSDQRVNERKQKSKAMFGSFSEDGEERTLMDTNRVERREY